MGFKIKIGNNGILVLFLLILVTTSLVGSCPSGLSTSLSISPTNPQLGDTVRFTCTITGSFTCGGTALFKLRKYIGGYYTSIIEDCAHKVNINPYDYPNRLNAVDPTCTGPESNGIYEFTLQSIIVEDAGQYNCVIVPNAASSPVSMTILYPPKVPVLTSPTHNFSNGAFVIKEGENLQLDCDGDQAGMTTPVTYTWYSVPTNVNTTGKPLTLSSISRTASGTYRCTVDNGAAVSNETAVNVLFPPSNISLEASPSVPVESSVLTLLCTTDSSNPLPDLQIIQTLNNVSSVLGSVTTSASLSVTLTATLTLNDGSVTCIATPSAFTDVKLESSLNYTVTPAPTTAPAQEATTAAVTEPVDFMLYVYIAIGAVGGLLLFVLMILIIYCCARWLCCRKRKKVYDGEAQSTTSSTAELVQKKDIHPVIVPVLIAPLKQAPKDINKNEKKSKQSNPKRDDQSNPKRDDDLIKKDAETTPSDKGGLENKVQEKESKVVSYEQPKVKKNIHEVKPDPGIITPVVIPGIEKQVQLKQEMSATKEPSFQKPQKTEKTQQPIEKQTKEDKEEKIEKAVLPLQKKAESTPEAKPQILTLPAAILIKEEKTNVKNTAKEQEPNKLVIPVTMTNENTKNDPTPKKEVYPKQENVKSPATKNMTVEAKNNDKKEKVENEKKDTNLPKQKHHKDIETENAKAKTVMPPTPVIPVIVPMNPSKETAKPIQKVEEKPLKQELNKGNTKTPEPKDNKGVKPDVKKPPDAKPSKKNEGKPPKQPEPKDNNQTNETKKTPNKSSDSTKAKISTPSAPVIVPVILSKEPVKPFQKVEEKPPKQDLNKRPLLKENAKAPEPKDNEGVKPDTKKLTDAKPSNKKEEKSPKQPEPKDENETKKRPNKSSDNAKAKTSTPPAPVIVPVNQSREEHSKVKPPKPVLVPVKQSTEPAKPPRDEKAPLKKESTPRELEGKKDQKLTNSKNKENPNKAATIDNKEETQKPYSYNEKKYEKQPEIKQESKKIEKSSLKAADKTKPKPTPIPLPPVVLVKQPFSSIEKDLKPGPKEKTPTQSMDSPLPRTMSEKSKQFDEARPKPIPVSLPAVPIKHSKEPTKEPKPSLKDEKQEPEKSVSSKDKKDENPKEPKPDNKRKMSLVKNHKPKEHSDVKPAEVQEAKSQEPELYDYTEKDPRYWNVNYRQKSIPTKDSNEGKQEPSNVIPNPKRELTPVEHKDKEVEDKDEVSLNSTKVVLVQPASKEDATPDNETDTEDELTEEEPEEIVDKKPLYPVSEVKTEPKAEKQHPPRSFSLQQPAHKPIVLDPGNLPILWPEPEEEIVPHVSEAISTIEKPGITEAPEKASRSDKKKKEKKNQKQPRLKDSIKQIINHYKIAPYAENEENEPRDWSTSYEAKQRFKPDKNIL